MVASSLHVGHHSVPLLDLCLSALHSSDAARCGDRLGQYGSEVKGLLGDDNSELPYCYVVRLLRPCHVHKSWNHSISRELGIPSGGHLELFAKLSKFHQRKEEERRQAILQVV